MGLMGAADEWRCRVMAEQRAICRKAKVLVGSGAGVDDGLVILANE